MSDLVNRKGMNVLEDLVLDLGWIPRRLSESDQGVDYILEQAPGGECNGRLLGVQLKSSAKAYAALPTKGFVFRFGSRHARLWLNYAIPVLVILVDVNNRRAHWQHVSGFTVTSTGKNFKLTVPPDQPLEAAGEAWALLASRIEAQVGAATSPVTGFDDQDARQFETVVSPGGRDDETSYGARFRADLSRALLPPATVAVLELADRHFEGNEEALRDLDILTVHLEKGRHTARETVAFLSEVNPSWMQRGPLPWRVLGSHASAHDLPDLAAAAFERAAQPPSDFRGRMYALAALHLVETDRAAAAALLNRADEDGGAVIASAVVRALSSRPQGSSHPSSHVDPVLLADGEEIRSDVLAQSFLAEDAYRRDELEAAVTYAKTALALDPASTVVMAALAEYLVRRSSRNRGEASDLAEGIALLERALAQRRQWAGPTAPTLIQLAEAYGVSGRIEDMYALCRPAPEGSATDAEAATPEVRRLAVLAAHYLDRPDLVRHAGEQLGDDPEDRVVKARVGLLQLEGHDMQDIWLESARLALGGDRWQELLGAVVQLARGGRDESALLVDAIERRIIPPHYVELVKSLVLAQTDLDAALVSLRGLAQRDALASEHLIDLLSQSGRLEQGARECQALFDLTRNAYFLVAQTMFLQRSGDDDEAENVARAALAQVGSDYPSEQQELRLFLAKRMAAREDWASAERHVADVVATSSPLRPSVTWLLVEAQAQQGHLRRAAESIRRHQPPVTRDAEATLWLQAMSVVKWDQATASQALGLARTTQDPTLAVSLLGQIISGTYAPGDPREPGNDDNDHNDNDGTAGTDESSKKNEADAKLDARRRRVQGIVSADIHVQAFEEMNKLVTEYGDSAGVQMHSGGTPEESLAQIRDVMRRDHSDAWDGLAAQVRDGQLPIGLLVNSRGRGYATALVQRTFGVLIAGSADDAEHEEEVGVATSALSAAVVVDASTLLTLSGSRQLSQELGRFAAVQAPPATLRDIYRATSDVRGLAGSPGTVALDDTRDEIVMYELDDDEFYRQLQRVTALEDISQRIVSRAVKDLTVMEGLAGHLEHGSWLAPVQLAHDRQEAFWSDDLGLRRFARIVGVPAFGTPALLEAVTRRKFETFSLDDPDGRKSREVLAELTSRLRELASDFVVDLPLHLEDLIEVARGDDWLPHSGAAVLSRAAWWAWQVTPVEDAIAFIKDQHIASPATADGGAYAEQIRLGWLGATMHGVGRAYREPDGPARQLMMALALATARPGSAVDDVLSAIRAARAAAEAHDIPDPATQLASAAAWVTQQGLVEGVHDLLTHVLERMDREPPA